jgi:REP element-mobilizing transposase RayT
MGRPLRDESPGYHHVVTRGNNKQAIYLDEDDRWFFCVTVDRIALHYGWTVIAYCLMDNHYHMILSIGEKGLSDGMRDLNTAVACRFNAKHGRINHLFGKRFWSRRIKTHTSMLSTIRYVVQNPRRAGGSRPLETYVWSSYAASSGSRSRGFASRRTSSWRSSDATRPTRPKSSGSSVRRVASPDTSGARHREVSDAPELRNCVLGAAAALRGG